MTVISNKITKNKAVIRYIAHSWVVGAGGAGSGAGGGSGATSGGEDVCALNPAGVGMVSSDASGS